MMIAPTEKQTVLAELAKLQSAVIGSNLDNAMRHFALGKAIVEGAERLAMMQSHLMNDASIHQKRGERATKWFRLLRDAEGNFDRDKYEQGVHMVADRVNAGKDKAGFDLQGHPSVSAIERAHTVTKQRSDPFAKGSPPQIRNGPFRERVNGENSPRVCSDSPFRERVAASPAEGIAALMLEDQGNEEIAEQIRRSAGTQDARSATDGRPPLVVGSQAQLPYALVETERELATAVERAQQMLASGELGDDDARSILGSLEKTIQITTNITNPKANA